MKIIFMGTPDYASEILSEIISQGIEVVAVYTQPDKPVGRKKIMTAPPVKSLALKHSIKVCQPAKLRESDVVDEVLGIECDFIVVAAYGQILPKEILEHAPCINLHASVLPQYRGASPIQQTLLNGDKITGVTAMLMDEGLDSGDIIKIETIEVDEDMMLEELFVRLTSLASSLTIDVLKNFKNYKPIKQDISKVTHCKKITKADGVVDFDNALKIYNKYRAFTPWPGIFLESGLKLKKIKLENKATKYESAKIIEISKESFVVGCAVGSIRVFSLQAPSKKETDAISYINGKRLGVEDYLT